MNKTISLEFLLRTLLIYFIGLTNPLICFSQNTINQYEYWYDGNYTDKTTIAVSPESTLDLNQLISTTSLPFGLHIFNIRFKDSNGLYSAVNSQHFYKPLAALGATNKIVAYEYWFDNNYVGKISQATSPQTSLQLINDISTSNLLSGLHIFNIRFKDESGQWSAATSQHFYKPNFIFGTNNITAYEYWFDNNYIKKTAQTAAPQNPLEIVSDINTDSLNSGLHIFNIRFKDERGPVSYTHLTLPTSDLV